MPTLTAFEAYRSKWEVRLPNLERQQFKDELILLEKGVSEFPEAPANDIIIGTPPKGKKLDEASMQTKYLWVISPGKIPYVLENGEIGAKLSRKSVSHTNLTGGEKAHCGGELWFKDKSAFWLCGGSSRYKARSAEELADIATSFVSCGYQVVNMGWDEETNNPVRLLRE